MQARPREGSEEATIQWITDNLGLQQQNEWLLATVDPLTTAHAGIAVIATVATELLTLLSEPLQTHLRQQ